MGDNHFETLYKQCRLERVISDTITSHTISWLPKKFAKPGMILKLKSDNGEWTAGWVVKFAGETERSGKWFSMYQRVGEKKGKSVDSVS